MQYNTLKSTVIETLRTTRWWILFQGIEGYTLNRWGCRFRLFFIVRAYGCTYPCPLIFQLLSTGFRGFSRPTDESAWHKHTAQISSARFWCRTSVARAAADLNAHLLTAAARTPACLRPVISECYTHKPIEHICLCRLVDLTKVCSTIHTVSASKQNGCTRRLDAVKEGCKRIQTIPYPSYIKRYTTMLSWEFPDKTFLPPHVYPFWHTAQAGSFPRDWDQGRFQLPFVRMRLSAFEWSPLDWQGVRIAQTHSKENYWIPQKYSVPWQNQCQNTIGRRTSIWTLFLSSRIKPTPDKYETGRFSLVNISSACAVTL